MSEVQKRLATDQSLQATNTALGLLGKDSSLLLIKAAIDALPNATQAAADNANAAATAANNAVANLGALIAITYSDSSTYNTGDYVYYNGNIYRCIVAISTPESFTATHWLLVHIGDELSGLIGAFIYSALRGFSGNVLKGVYSIEKGTINPATGGETSSENRARTVDFIKNEISGLLLPVSGYKIRILGYSSLQGPSGYIAYDDWVITSAATYLTVNPSWACFRLVISREDDGDLSANDLNTIASNLTIITAGTDTQFIYADRPADGKAIGEVMDKVINRNNILSYGKRIDGAYYDGIEEESSSYLYFIVPVVSGKTYVFETPVRFLSTISEIIGSNYAVGSTYTATYTGDLYITFDTSYASNMIVHESTVSIIEVPKYGDIEFNRNTFKTGVDTYLDKTSNNLLKYAVLKENYFYNGYEEANENYSYFIVPVTNGVTYVFGTACRFVASKESNLDANIPAGGTYTATYTGDLYVTFYNDDSNGWMMYESTVNFVDVPAYGEPEKIQETVHDVLKGKVWYACGDSFTEGDYTGYTGVYRFTDQPYMGKKMVYPFFIGRRTGCVVKNLASSGSTLAAVSGSTNTFINIYQNIGADADYITIKYGINDGHQGVPIGTIDSTDPSTFYGAWNVVMSWIINNRPNAKIGIIVSNGLDNNSYADATIAIAKKYGVPYLNEWNGEQVPVLIRSGRTDVDPDILQLRTDTWKVSNSNWHPNKECHKYESTFVEAFLKAL